MGNVLHGTEELELILDLNQVITRIGVQSWHLDANRDKVVQDFLDDISNTILSAVGLNSWVKDDISISQVNLDVEHWWKSLMFVVGDADLVGKVVHGSLNSLSHTFDNQSVDIVLVRQPSGRFFVWLDVISSVFKEFVDFLSVVLDILKSGNDQSRVDLFKIIWEEWLQLSLEEWFLPRGHHSLNLLDVLLHLLDELVLLIDNIHGLLDEWINVLGVPLQCFNTSFK